MIQKPRDYDGPAVGDYIQAEIKDAFGMGEVFVSRDGRTLDISDSVRRGGIHEGDGHFGVEGYVLRGGKPVATDSGSAIRTWYVDVEADAESGGYRASGTVTEIVQAGG